MSFYNNLLKFGEEIAVIADNGEEISYNQLVVDADSVVENIPQRNLVFLVCSNNYASLAAYIGLLRKKIVPVLVSDKVEQSLVEELLRIYRPNYVIAPSSFLWLKGEVVKNFRNYSFFLTDAVIEHDLYPHLALLLTTSGSTGSPKLVRQSYDNINSNTSSIVDYLRISPSDRAITTMPMSYAFGLSIIQSHLAVGASIVLTDFSLMQKEFWTLLKERNVTTLSGVPYIFEMLKRLRFNTMDLPCLRYITQAGGKLSLDLCKEFTSLCRDKGIEFIVMYGQTEATARMSYLPWKYAEDKLGSIGIAIPGGVLSLVDENNQEIERNGVVGELRYNGRNVCLGYAENYSDLARGDDWNGVLLTGDLAKFDEDGFFCIVGRKKRFLKIFGNRINLDEIEALLKRNGFECIATGDDDNMVIYSTDENVAKIRSIITGFTGIARTAFKVRIISEIPRNEAGKILYSAITNEYTYD